MPSHLACLIHSYSKRQTRQKEKGKYTLECSSPHQGSVQYSPIPILSRGVSAVCHCLPGDPVSPVCSGIFQVWLYHGGQMSHRVFRYPPSYRLSLDDHQQWDCQMYSEGVARHWPLQGHQSCPQLGALGGERRSGVSSNSILTYAL